MDGTCSGSRPIDGFDRLTEAFLPGLILRQIKMSNVPALRLAPGSRPRGGGGPRRSDVVGVIERCCRWWWWWRWWWVGGASISIFTNLTIVFGGVGGWDHHQLQRYSSNRREG